MEASAAMSDAIRIALLPGDGIGPEVTGVVRLLAEALHEARVMDLELVDLDWGAEHYLATGETVPPGGFDVLRGCAAVFVGAFGDPRVPDFRHARDILLGLRRELDLFVNLRPVRCVDESLNRLRGVRPEEIDIVFVRENTEGLYCGVGGSLSRGGREEVAIEEMIATREGIDRVTRFAFRFARENGRRRVTLVDKANVLRHVGVLWRTVFDQIAAEFDELERDHLFVDTAAYELVRNPGRFDVVVTENLFGDVLSDLAAALQGGLGLAASANLHPGRTSMFEPVHGSAPDIAGTGTANPLAALASFALLLRTVGEARAASAIDDTIVALVRAGRVTPDLGGSSTTREVGEAARAAVMERLAA